MAVPVLGTHGRFLTRPCQSCSLARADLGQGSPGAGTGVLQSIPGDWRFTFDTQRWIFPHTGLLDGPRNEIQSPPHPCAYWLDAKYASRSTKIVLGSCCAPCPRPTELHARKGETGKGQHSRAAIPPVRACPGTSEK